MRDTGPCSTTRPAYITASWSHILATMPRLWVMKISASPCSRCRSRSRLRYCAWIVRSRLVVGSSAITRRGSEADALVQIAQQVEILRLDREIEAGGRFVGDQQARLAGDADRADDALAHAARHLVR